MPKVAVFSANFLPISQTFVHDEIRYHTRYGVEVFSKERQNAERFPFEPVHVGGPLYALTRWSGKFHRILSQGGFDLIHAHFGTHAMYALPYVKRLRLPLAITFHGYDVPLLGSTRRLLPQHWGYALLGRSVLEHMTLGLCTSSEMRELLLDQGVPERKLVVHRLGIDLGAFQKGERDARRPRVLMIGRQVEKKGFEYGLRAFAKVRARGVQASLTMIGGGERHEKLKRIAAEQGLGDAVRFLGTVPQATLLEELSRSDVLLAPSAVALDGDRDTGLIVVKEASASEVVPIGTWHGGIPDIIDDGVTGYLVQERNVERMAERLEELLLDPEKRARMGRAAREKMEREYDNRARVAALEEFYDRAIESHRARAAGA